MSLKYTKEHEWVQADGATAVVGITHHAQDALGDVVFVEVPEVGKKVAKGSQAAVVESVKAASEVYAPVSGEVTAGNTALADNPGLVNSSAMGDGWFFKLKLTNAAESGALLTPEAYKVQIGG